MASAGLGVSYIYYRSTDDFVPNGHPYAHLDEGWFGKTKSSTLIFILANFLYIFLAFLTYKGKPWKKPLWKSRALFIYTLILSGIAVAISLLTQKL